MKEIELSAIITLEVLHLKMWGRGKDIPPPPPPPLPNSDFLSVGGVAELCIILAGALPSPPPPPIAWLLAKKENPPVGMNVVAKRRALLKLTYFFLYALEILEICSRVLNRHG